MLKESVAWTGDSHLKGSSDVSSGEELGVAESDVASDDSEKEVVEACVSYRRRFSLM